MDILQQEILAFRQDFIDYFNKNIINNHDIETQVECIEDEIKITNRGHGIVFRIQDRNMGLIFYAEELMHDLKEKTLAEIANMINRQISEMKVINMPVDIPYSAFEPDDKMILTAMPTKHIPTHYGLQEVEYEQKDEIGLTVFLKTEIPGSPIPGAYGHVRKLTDSDDKKIIFAKALANTLRYSHIAMMMSNEVDDQLPVMFHIVDQNKFADYFYLATTKVISDISKDMGFKELYIFPQSAYDAIVLGAPKTMIPEVVDYFNSSLSDIIKRYDAEGHPISACKYDVDTDTITPIKEA